MSAAKRRVPRAWFHGFAQRGPTARPGHGVEEQGHTRHTGNLCPPLCRHCTALFSSVFPCQQPSPLPFVTLTPLRLEASTKAKRSRCVAPRSRAVRAVRARTRAGFGVGWGLQAGAAATVAPRPSALPARLADDAAACAAGGQASVGASRSVLRSDAHRRPQPRHPSRKGQGGTERAGEENGLIFCCHHVFE